MKELRIKYKDQKSLEDLLKMLDKLGIAYDFPDLEKNEMVNINGVTMIKGKGTLIFNEMMEEFTNLNLDPVTLRKNSWQRDL
jgi:molecular chaperone GrpE (heat shock protein)